MNLKNNNQLHFEPVNSENRREAENLSVFSEQSGFIESVGECLQEADNLNLWRPVCIYDGDTLVGFAMYGYFPSPFPGRLWLDRLLTRDIREKDMGGRPCLPCLTDSMPNIQTAWYISVCMKIIQGQSAFMNRLASALTANMTRKANM